MDYPIVFIPGLFGSIGDDVIKGTGKFSFGFAEKIYLPFIEILNAMGYEENVNLFVSYYDWKKPVLEAVEKYLYPDIEKAKAKVGSDKVILIGHSLGGLLGRAYINYFSPNSIDKLIMIGTPNLGTVNAYYFWSGGKMPYSKVEENILYNGLKIGFALYYRMFKGINQIDALKVNFPVVADLLPSFKYGNYLFYEENGVNKEISIENMSISNGFLNSLDKNPIDSTKLYIISGKGVFTNKQFLVKANTKGKAKWIDGEPIRTYRSDYGDGTVTTHSTLGDLVGEKIVLEGDHIDILYSSKEYLSKILNKPIIKDVKIEKIEKTYIIFARSKIQEVFDISKSRIQTIKLGEDKFWIMVTGDRNLEVNIDRNIMPKIYKKVIVEGQ